jgi:bifunctional pyridoxal-dependent enzyme with beta-cystathionase and maltose regulon repressor activities
MTETVPHYMTHPQLRLLSRPSHSEDHTPLYVDVDSARLWDLIFDEKVYLVLRRPALVELARRKDPKLMDYCENLLKSDDYEDWLTGLATLSAVGTNEAVDSLILAYAHSFTGWTRVAISTLQDACKRFGVETIIDGRIPDLIEEATEFHTIDDLTTTPER